MNNKRISISERSFPLMFKLNKPEFIIVINLMRLVKSSSEFLILNDITKNKLSYLTGIKDQKINFHIKNIVSKGVFVKKDNEKYVANKDLLWVVRNR